MRVCEDIARFIIEDKKISLELKSIRQKTNIVRKFYGNEILNARRSKSDFGRKSDYDMMKRNGVEEIMKTSFGRAEEASRALEEFSKPHSVRISAILKNIRFSLYDLEKKAMLKLRFVIPVFEEKIGLYLVMTDPTVGYEKLAEISVEAKIKVIQLRDKKMNDRKLLMTAKKVKSITKGSGTLFIVNDRADIAVLADADGVHLGQSDVSVADARRMSDRMIIGKSTHNLKQIKNALKEFPDYIGIGPVFKTFSKKIPDKELGLENASLMLKQADIPAVAIGGIKDYNLKNVLMSGFQNFAVVSYVTESDKPKECIKNLQKIYRRKNEY